MKPLKNYDKYTKLSIGLIIIFAVIIFTLASIYHVSGDACWHLSVARFMAEENKIPLNENLGRDEPFWAPPLFHITAAFVNNLFNSDFAMKFVSPFFSILTLIFIFLLTKKLFNTKIAFYTLVFLAFIPLFIDYSVFSYVEGMLLFFIVLSVYFAINNRVVLASITAGLGILTKYNALFIIPLLIYIAYKNNKKNRNLIKNILIVLLIPMVIASPWFIRNWLVLGNPIWPFLNFIFHGLSISPYSNLHLGRLIDVQSIIFTYLGLFGVPNGNPQNLFFFKIPSINLLLAIWLFGTLLFLLPLVFARKLKNKKFIAVWVSFYIFLFLLYIANVGFGVTRIMLPAIPPIAMIWAAGFSRLLNHKYKKIIILILVLIIAGFISTEFLKLHLTSKEWNTYKNDFDWAKTNTEKDSKFMAGGQCSSYNLNRQTLYPSEENIKHADYIWVNQDFRLDKRTIINKALLDLIDEEQFQVVYQNDNTGTIIYKVR